MAERAMSCTEVLIVGAGPSGLALAIELGSRGISCRLVERNGRVGYAPRAKTVNVRTRTHLRRWGIADKLANASPLGVGYPSDVHFVTRLGGLTLARIENASNCNPARQQDYPEHGQWIPQYKLEEVMRVHAIGLPSVRISFRTEFISATQTNDRVTVRLRDLDRNEDELVDCSYLAGADGAGSAVRQQIGATMIGQHGLSRNYNIVFRAPGLAEAHQHGPGIMYWQVNPATPSLIGPMDENNVWFFMPTRLPEDFKITPETAGDLIRRATGIDLPYEILSSDEWAASCLIANRYRDDRIFLIGDACHLHPPFGGYGMNMGVADGVDLGWKLAAVCQTWGGPALLDSYEQERRPMHLAIMEEAAANHAVLSNDLWSDDLERKDRSGATARKAAGARIISAKSREFNTLGTVLGLCYPSSAILSADAGQPCEPHGMQYLPNSRPGCLAPHFWRSDGRSLYDCFGKNFALICRPKAEESEIEGALSEARVDGVPVELIKLAPEDPLDRYPAKLTLIRPDQYIAWRGDTWQTGIFSKATGWKLG